MLRSYINRFLLGLYPLAQPFLPFQVFAFLTVGTMNTLLNLGMFWVLYPSLLPGRYALEIATFLVFSLTAVSGFWLQRNFAFPKGKGQSSIQAQFAKYVLVSLQGVVGAYLLTKALVVWMHWNGLVAYAVTTVIVLTITYFLQKYMTFRSRKQR